MGSLQGRIVIVTGGASGIGAAATRAFHAAGATVVIGDIQDASDIAAEVGGAFLATDVTDAAAVGALVKTTVERYGRLDVYFNNAGIESSGPMAEMDPEVHRRVIDIDVNGVFYGLQAAVKAISAGEGALDVKICQIVRLMDKGEPMKMSKRAGTFVTLRDLVDEVGQEVVRFHMLTRKNDAQMDFDLAVLTEKSRDNPIWYVQYVSARCHSARAEARKHFPNHDMSLHALGGTTISCLTDESELGLIKLIAGWPRLVEAAADAHEPHRIAYYLYELAAQFHAFWEKGKDPSFKIVQEDNEKLTMARLVLVQGVQTVIDSGLGIFGIEPVEEMR